MKRMSASKEDKTAEAAVQPSPSAQTKKCTCSILYFSTTVSYCIWWQEEYSAQKAIGSKPFKGQLTSINLCVCASVFTACY